MHTGIYYRLHWDGCPEFTADNAWSPSSWGTERSNDGSQEECTLCWGNGSGLFHDDGRERSCRACEDTGWADCRRGYSCCSSPEELITYLRHVWPSDEETVVEFKGAPSGEQEWDGADLAIPHAVVRTWTWGTFTAQYANTGGV